MSLRRAAADGDAAAAASGEAEEETWAEVSLYERGAEGERSFRASVDGASVRGTAYLEAEADGMDGVAGCGATLSLFVEGEMVRLQVSDVAQQARQRLSAAAQGAGAAAASVVSPMPGKIVRVLASAGRPSRPAAPRCPGGDEDGAHAQGPGGRHDQGRPRGRGGCGRAEGGASLL